MVGDSYFFDHNLVCLSLGFIGEILENIQVHYLTKIFTVDYLTKIFPNLGYADSPLCFDPVSMDDGECAEQYQKNNEKNSDFYFSTYREKFVENWGDDVKKLPYLKKKNPKNYCSFYSADSESFM